MSTGTLFGYDAALVERFPAVRACVVHASGLVNAPSPAALIELGSEAQRRALQRLEAEPIAELPPIRAWRDVFHACGVKPTRHRVAVEALLRRLHKGGEVPAINGLVDIGNLVAIDHALPIAVFDRAAISGALTVRFASGEERFVELGAAEPTVPAPGEVVFVDERGRVAARRWCWRQSAPSAAGETTEEALFVIEGHHESAEQDVARAGEALVGLLARFQPACRTRSYALSPRDPRA